MIVFGNKQNIVHLCQSTRIIHPSACCLQSQIGWMCLYAHRWFCDRTRKEDRWCVIQWDLDILMNCCSRLAKTYYTGIPYYWVTWLFRYNYTFEVNQQWCCHITGVQDSHRDSDKVTDLYLREAWRVQAKGPQGKLGEALSDTNIPACSLQTSWR